MARWANELGLRSLEGNCIDRLSMRKILTNVAYAGQVAYRSRRGGGVVAKGKHPAIVDAALYAKAQKTLACRRRYTAPTRPFRREAYPQRPSRRRPAGSWKPTEPPTPETRNRTVRGFPP